MAGTPTPNYQFPTYAETDTPNLAGAYNQAVNAIDAKIKEVADTIPSGADVPDANSTTKGIAKLYDSSSIGDSTQEDGGVTPAAMKAAVDGASVDVSGKADKFTVKDPITYSGNQIGVRAAVPDDPSKSKGIVAVTGGQANIANATDLKSIIVPNVKAVKDYVDAKVSVEQQAYTGTAPIVVNNGEHTISVSGATAATSSDSDNLVLGNRGVVDIIDTQSAYNAVKRHAGDTSKPDWFARAYNSAVSVGLVINATPDASTSMKGLVQLNGDGTDSTNKTLAMTASSTVKLMKAVGQQTVQKVTVQDLANNLYISPSTGLVFWKQQP